jgi:predicted DsbA family dithiol-disulfide isomerase
MVDYAQTVGKQDAVIERIFKRYFEQGDNISNTDVLKDIAMETGLDAASTMKHIEDPTVISKINQEAGSAHDQGVNGVPYFVMSMKGESSGSHPGFSGAQPPATFRSAINRLLMHAKV